MRVITGSACLILVTYFTQVQPGVVSGHQSGNTCSNECILLLAESKHDKEYTKKQYVSKCEPCWSSLLSPNVGRSAHLHVTKTCEKICVLDFVEMSSGNTILYRKSRKTCGICWASIYHSTEKSELVSSKKIKMIIETLKNKFPINFPNFSESSLEHGSSSSSSSDEILIDGRNKKGKKKKALFIEIHTADKNHHPSDLNTLEHLITGHKKWRGRNSPFGYTASKNDYGIQGSDSSSRAQTYDERKLSETHTQVSESMSWESSDETNNNNLFNGQTISKKHYSSISGEWNGGKDLDKNAMKSLGAQYIWKKGGQQQRQFLNFTDKFLNKGKNWGTNMNFSQKGSSGNGDYYNGQKITMDGEKSFNDNGIITPGSQSPWSKGEKKKRMSLDFWPKDGKLEIKEDREDTSGNAEYYNEQDKTATGGGNFNTSFHSFEHTLSSETNCDTEKKDCLSNPNHVEGSPGTEDSQVSKIVKTSESTFEQEKPDTGTENLTEKGQDSGTRIVSGHNSDKQVKTSSETHRNDNPGNLEYTEKSGEAVPSHIPDTVEKPEEPIEQEKNVKDVGNSSEIRKIGGTVNLSTDTTDEQEKSEKLLVGIESSSTLKASVHSHSQELSWEPSCAANTKICLSSSSQVDQEKTDESNGNNPGERQSYGSLNERDEKNDKLLEVAPSNAPDAEISEAPIDQEISGTSTENSPEERQDSVSSNVSTQSTNEQVEPTDKSLEALSNASNAEILEKPFDEERIEASTKNPSEEREEGISTNISTESTNEQQNEATDKSAEVEHSTISDTENFKKNGSGTDKENNSGEGQVSANSTTEQQVVSSEQTRNESPGNSDNEKIAPSLIPESSEELKASTGEKIPSTVVSNFPIGSKFGGFLNASFNTLEHDLSWESSCEIKGKRCLSASTRVEKSPEEGFEDSGNYLNQVEINSEPYHGSSDSDNVEKSSEVVPSHIQDTTKKLEEPIEQEKSTTGDGNLSEVGQFGGSVNISAGSTDAQQVKTSSETSLNESSSNSYVAGYQKVALNASADSLEHNLSWETSCAPNTKSCPSSPSQVKSYSEIVPSHATTISETPETSTEQNSSSTYVQNLPGNGEMVVSENDSANGNGVEQVKTSEPNQSTHESAVAEGQERHEKDSSSDKDQQNLFTINDIACYCKLKNMSGSVEAEIKNNEVVGHQNMDSSIYIGVPSSGATDESHAYFTIIGRMEDFRNLMLFELLKYKKVLMNVLGEDSFLNLTSLVVMETELIVTKLQRFESLSSCENSETKNEYQFLQNKVTLGVSRCLVDNIHKIIKEILNINNQVVSRSSSTIMGTVESFKSDISLCGEKYELNTIDSSDIKCGLIQKYNF